MIGGWVSDEVINESFRFGSSVDSFLKWERRNPADLDQLRLLSSGVVSGYFVLQAYNILS
jgi:hypothetical protein